MTILTVLPDLESTISTPPQNVSNTSPIITQTTGNFVDCGVNSYNTLHTFSALAPKSSHTIDQHITRRLGSESDPRKQDESSCAAYTLTHFSRQSVLHGSAASYPGLLEKSSNGDDSRCGVAEKTT